MAWAAALTAATAAQVAVFGETVTHDGTSVSGIFDSRYIEVDTGGGAPVSMLVTVLSIAAGSIDPAVGEAVTARGINYIVRDIRPDGGGLTTLILERP
jgi:hypothetical protein